jgi:uncharacterized glyoxalase superfamily protein PhnB
MRADRSVPTATVIPELPYENVDAASDWLCRAFGFRERLRIGDHRAQLVLGDGAVILTSRTPREYAALLVRVDDADRHHEQAKKAGARILQPPADHPYGERQYIAEDATWGGTLR